MLRSVVVKGGVDTAARIEAAKARLDAGREVLLRAKEAGPPCRKCRFYIPVKFPADRPKEGPYCGHPALTNIAYDAATGNVRETIHISPAQARTEDGLCGFEGTLFERRKGALLWPLLVLYPVLPILGYWLLSAG